MTVRVRNGFTLVEMLVVITIIGLLVAMVIPAVQAAIESARQTSCANKLKQLALATIAYETNKNRFPGYRDKVPTPQDQNYEDPRWSDVGGGKPWYKGGRWETWVVQLFPYIGKSDQWRRWQVTSSNLTGTHLEGLICPSNAFETNGAALNYVANSGRWDEDLGDKPDTAANGVFHDQMTRRPVHVTLGHLNRGDGSAATIMYSENLQAYKYDDAVGEDSGDKEFKEHWVCIVWWPGGSGVRRINGDKEKPPRQDENYARPSSNHADGVNVAYCSGATGFVAEDVDYRVYRDMMTVNGDEAARQ